MPLTRKEAIRRFVLFGVVSHPALVALACSSVQTVSGAPAGGSLEDVLPTLQELEKNPSIEAREGFWKPGQVFSHCAQSVRYARTGFPEMKSALFRSTVGTIAFGVFSMRDSMSHGITEEIPGAEAIDPELATRAGLQALIAEIQTFLSYSGPLQPHFAYGELSHEQYNRANTWHLINHWDGLKKT